MILKSFLTVSAYILPAQQNLCLQSILVSLALVCSQMWLVSSDMEFHASQEIFAHDYLLAYRGCCRGKKEGCVTE